jgi:hypothetical protein
LIVGIQHKKWLRTMTARYSIFLFALEFNGGITIKACVVVNGIVVLLDWCCEKIKVMSIKKKGNVLRGEWREF